MEKVDLDELENLYFPHTGIIHYFGDADLSYLNPILKAVPEMIAELKLLRSENETIKKDFKALFEGRVNDYNNRIADLEDQIYKLEKVAEASEDYLLNHESAETCFSCDSDMTHYDRVELALKEWKGKNGK